jgi:glycosyltransferase involved in cell wall biosynthesis
MRILHVATPTSSGRVERLIHAMAGAQRAQGDEVHIATLTGDPHQGRRVGELGPRNSLSRLRSAEHWGRFSQIEDLGRRFRPDVVHTHASRAEELATRVARQADAAIVTTVHGEVDLDLHDRRHRWSHVVRERDGIVAVSDPMGTQLLTAGVPADRLRIIPDAVPYAPPRIFRSRARETLGLPADRWLIGWIGDLCHEEGLDLLLDALALLPDLGISVAILGDGPERSRLARQAQSLRVDQLISWCGSVTEAARFLPAFDLLVVSARARDSSDLLLSAMSACVPILATEAPGVSGTVTPAAAMIIPPDDPVELAAAIHHARAYPENIVRRSLRAHVRWSRLSDTKQWAMNYSRAYEAAIRRRRSPSPEFARTS